jgi:hypothetical protein
LHGEIVKDKLNSKMVATPTLKPTKRPLSLAGRMDLAWKSGRLRVREEGCDEITKERKKVQVKIEQIKSKKTAIINNY